MENKLYNKLVIFSLIRWFTIKPSRIIMIILIAYFVVFPIICSIVSYYQLKELCKKFGGLTIDKNMSGISLYTKTVNPVFAKDDPVMPMVRKYGLYNQGPIGIWPSGAIYKSCSDGDCVSFNQDRYAYIDISNGIEKAYIVASKNYPCKASLSTVSVNIYNNIRSRMLKDKSIYANDFKICDANGYKRDQIKVMGPSVSSNLTNWLYGNHIQFVSWRIFNFGQAKEVVQYNQFGFYGYITRIINIIPNMMGLSADYTNTQCTINSKLIGIKGNYIFWGDVSDLAPGRYVSRSINYINRSINND